MSKPTEGELLMLQLTEAGLRWSRHYRSLARPVGPDPEGQELAYEFIRLARELVSHMDRNAPAESG